MLYDKTVNENALQLKVQLLQQLTGQRLCID